MAGTVLGAWETVEINRILTLVIADSLSGGIQK